MRDNGDEKRKIQGREKENEDTQSHVDCSFAASAAGNEGVDFSCACFDGGFKRVIVDCVLAAGNDSTGEHILIPKKSALILFVSAWLISPAGLPLAAQKSCLRCCMRDVNGCRIG